MVQFCLIYRIPPPRLVEAFVEVLSPEEGKEPIIKRFYPEIFEEKEGTLQQVPRFCYPCQTDSPGVQYFTFVLTDIDGKFRFGFCRYPPHATSCICLISYVPWYEMFYVVLNNIQELELKGDKDFVKLLLDQLLQHPIPDPGSSLVLEIECKESKRTFKYDAPDTTKLPSIPASRNLTEYFAAINPEIMVQIFISMLFERRILVTSRRLSLLTAVVHGSVSLLYPMQWQHIYVPVLPPHLIDYCCAPMPFLLGVHSSMMKSIQDMPLDEVVIVDADNNKIEYPFDDMEVFPNDVYNKLLGRIKKTEKALEDYVATQFLRALVALIGGYRDALVFKDSEDGGSIIFDETLFLDSRSSHMRPFLEFVLTLQSFQQFIASRLDILNSGIGFADVFEEELAAQSANHSKHKTQYQQWMNKMKKGGGAFKKTVGERFVHLKAKASDVEFKDKFKGFYKGAKSGVKTGYKGAKSHLKDVRQYLKPKDAVDGEEDMKARSNPGSPVTRERVRTVPVKRQSSMPTVKAMEVKGGKFRHTVYSSMPPERVHHRSSRGGPPKPRTPPPRPPPPTAVRKSQSYDALQSRHSAADTPISSASSTPPMARVEGDEDIPFDMLLDIETIELEENTGERSCQAITESGVTNPAFNVFDDSFCVIGDEAEEMGSPKDVVFHKRPSIPPRPDIIPDDKSQPPNSEAVNIRRKPPGIPDLMQFDGTADMDKFVLISPNKETAELSLADLLTDSQACSQGPSNGIPPLSPVGPILPNTRLYDETVDCVSDETRLFLCNNGNSPDVTLHNHQSSNATEASSHVDLLGDLSPPKSKPPLPTKPAFLSLQPKQNLTRDPFEDLIIQTKSTLKKPSQ